jgi:hypothetical protein
MRFMPRPGIQPVRAGMSALTLHLGRLQLNRGLIAFHQGKGENYPFDQNRSKGGLKGAKKGQIPVDLTDAQGGHSSAPSHSRSPADTVPLSVPSRVCSGEF